MPVPVQENNTTAIQPDWASLVSRIQAGEDAAMEQLYKLFNRGIRYYLCRQLGPQELEDKVHDTFLIVVGAIWRGDLREPERLMGFVRTIVRRQVAGFIEHAVESRLREVSMDDTASGGHETVYAQQENPEQQCERRETSEIMQEALRHLASRDREILVRFYLHEQRPEQICKEMDLTETQFRLLKSRAKSKFGEVGKRKLSQTGIFGRLGRKHTKGPEPHSNILAQGLGNEVAHL